MELHFYNFTKLFLKDITTDIINWDSANWESQTFCIDAQFYIFFCTHVPTASFYILCKCLVALVEYEDAAFAS